MLWLVLTWVLLFALFGGIGAGVETLLRRIARRDTGAMSAIELFWLGLCVAIALLQLYSLFLPLNRVPRVLLIIIAIAGLPWLCARIWTGSRDLPSSVLLWRALGAVVITLLILSSAIAPVLNADTQAVHFQQIKWIESYGTPLGLANLYSRYGFDSSGYILGALVDDWTWKAKEAHVAFPFIVWVALNTSLIVVTARNRPEWKSAKIFCLFTAPFFFGLLQVGNILCHFSGEVMGGCCALVAVTLLLCSPPSAEKAQELPTGRRDALMLSMAVASLGVTAKMSNVGLLAVLVALTLVVVFREVDRERRVPMLVVVGVLPLLLVGGMMLRRILLTGWPLYPVPIGGLPFSWAVSKTIVTRELSTIANYARWPERYNEVGANGFQFWFTPWFADLRRTPEWICLLSTLGALALLSTSQAVRKQLPRPSREALAAIVCGFVPLVGNFLSAPSPRFMSVFFWLWFAAVMAYMAGNLIADSAGGRLAVAAVAFMYAWLTGSLNFAWSYHSNWTDTSVFSAAEDPVTTTYVVPNGDRPPLIVNVPSGRHYCFDAPLPCVLTTPEPTELFRQRVPGNLGKGFLPWSR